MALARPTRNKIPLRVRGKIAPYQSGQRGVESVHFLFLGDLPATLSFTGPTNLTNAIVKGMTGGLSFTGAFNAARIILLTAVLSFTGNQSRRINSGLSGTLSFAGAITRRTASGLVGATLSFTGAFVKQTQRRFRANTAYTNVILADSPVGYWRLGDFGSVGMDSSGNGNPGVYGGTTTRGVLGGIIGDPDPAVLFDGASGKLDVNWASIINPSPNFSVEGWWNTPIQAANNPILDCRPASSGPTAAGFDLFINGGNGIGISVCSNNVSQTLLTAFVPFNVWNHAVATYDGSQVRLYVNGVLKGGPTSCPYTANPTSKSSIGHLTNGGANFVNGNLDEIAVYSTALSGATILAHYNAGITSFDSAYVNFATSLARSIRKGMSATLSFGGSLIKKTLRAMAAALSFTGATTRLIFKGLSGALSFTGVVAAARFFIKALIATLSFIGTSSKTIRKSLSGDLSFSGSLSRFISKALGAALSFVGVFARLLPNILIKGHSIVVNARYQLTLQARQISTGNLTLIRWYYGTFKRISTGTFRAVSRAINNFLTQHQGD